MIARGEIAADPAIDEAQIQPASIDLRLGTVAYRVPASFLPGPAATVADKLAGLSMHEIDLTGGAVLTWWVVPIMLAAGFITPLPYNYWRLKALGKACH